MTRASVGACALSLLLLCSCSGDDDEGDDGAGSNASSSGSGGSRTGTAASGGVGATSGTTGTAGVSGVDPLGLCEGSACVCNDGMDNDSDGEIDGFDAECTGPNDNDEGSFATGIPGDNIDPKWQDCFFDGNSGAGNDGCRYSTDCLTGVKTDSDPDCTVTQMCLDYCLDRTPNGCDCFGCCLVRGTDGRELYVVISADCQEDALDECQACVPSPTCGHECGECELCPGRTVADLPESCRPPPSDAGGGVPYECDNGAQTCMSNSDCPSGGYYCSLGCCRLVAPE